MALEPTEEQVRQLADRWVAERFGSLREFVEGSIRTVFWPSIRDMVLEEAEKACNELNSFGEYTLGQPGTAAACMKAIRAMKGKP